MLSLETGFWSIFLAENTVTHVVGESRYTKCAGEYETGSIAKGISTLFNILSENSSIKTNVYAPLPKQTF